MSRVELIMLICLVSIPIIALVIILPKKIQFHKKNKPTKAKEDKVEKPPEPKQVEQPTIEEEYHSDYKTDDNDLNSIRSYVSEKKKTTSPVRKNPTNDVPFGDYISPRRSFTNRSSAQGLSVREQFDALSPEMKALILAGAFYKKDYDDV